MALYNLVSSAARFFPLPALELPPSVRCALAPLAPGDLADELRQLHSDFAPMMPTASPTHRLPPRLRDAAQWRRARRRRLSKRPTLGGARLGDDVRR